jgi:alkanesulfonate monooxygenase SsuD/methylene tetrahydromethanopterin reductase-like flavin-dependent oxidoreductase (luciferase family)
MAVGFEERGKTMGHQPLRRNTFVAPTTEEAIAQFVKVSRDRYLAYAQKELDRYDEEELMRNFYETVKNSVAVGTAQEVIDHFTHIARELPVDPIVLRPEWPGMSIDEVLANMELMGREVIPALADVAPMPIEDIPSSLAPVAAEVAREVELLG